MNINEEILDTIEDYYDKKFSSLHARDTIISIFEKFLDEYYAFIAIDKNRCSADKTYSALAIMELIERLKK